VRIGSVSHDYARRVTRRLGSNSVLRHSSDRIDGAGERLTQLVLEQLNDRRQNPSQVMDDDTVEDSREPHGVVGSERGAMSDAKFIDSDATHPVRRQSGDGGGRDLLLLASLLNLGDLDGILQEEAPKIRRVRARCLAPPRPGESFGNALLRG
jgi:hypothetical protein